ALTCAVIALALGMFGSGLIAGFVLLGCLLIAAALALPAILGAALFLAERQAQPGLSTWFWADTRQQLPGLSLALMALLLALAANIGVGTMVGSFRSTFTGWLDQRLVSELYVKLESADDQPAFEAFVGPHVDAVLPIWNTVQDILGAPAEIFGVVDHPTYRDNWPLLAQADAVWDRISNGEGALINEQLARREGLKPGSVLPMPGDWQTEVLGVYSDYGNPLGQVILPLNTLTARYADISKDDFGLRLPSERVAELRKALVNDFGLPPDNLIDQASLKAFSLQVFERTFAVTGALNVLTLSVAGFAILTSLLTLASLRLPQLAPVWALGLPRATLSKIEILRAVTLASLTFIIAIPVGLVLAWVLLSVINVEAFGWQIPMQIFPSQWIWLGALSLLAAALASLWPARQLVKRPPSDLIRVFANER
ncbi:MAG: ABC transporter permease, partial [Boseongicola sp.]|nr:ABC transporter permease [Boseongicola sp.]